MLPVRFIAAFLFGLLYLALNEPGAFAQVQAPELGRQATAVRTERPPRLDGTLDDPLWQTAPPITDFRQEEPLETKPATNKTEVHILYDGRRVYFATLAVEIIGAQGVRE